MQVDIGNWQFFSGFIAIYYWDATQMLSSHREWCIFSTAEGFLTKSTALADPHSSHIEFLTQNPQARNGFPSVKLSPSLLPNLVSTFHISLGSKQLRHNVPIRGNYPHSANCYVIFLHFKSNRIQMFAFCRSNMRMKKLLHQPSKISPTQINSKIWK